MKKIVLSLMAIMIALSAFTQNPVTVVSPNGGENWIIGCPAQIQWVTTSTAGPVKIELFKNNVFYMPICGQVPPGMNTFTWYTPFNVIPGSNYKVKISSLTSISLFDFSDNTFSILKGNIQISAPNGGETWVKGTMHPITWTDNICESVRIELWKGGQFNSLVASSVPASVSSFNWNIPNVATLIPGNDYKVKIVAMSNSAGTTGMVFDFSDSVFSIMAGANTSQISVIQPNGGENWLVGCPNPIQWISSSAAVGPVKIELFKNEVFLLTIASQVPSNQNNFTWIPPWSLIPGNNYKVKVSSLTSAAIFDFSNGNFSISRGTITVVAPNGGETWVKGTMHPIVWNDNLCDNVRIELWKGGVFHSVVASSVPSSGNFNWMIPNVSGLVPGSDYKIKVMSAINITSATNMVFDFSDSTFSILAGASTGQLTVVKPNGGENWLEGCPNQIQWISSSTTVGSVKIELYRNDVFLLTICPQVPANLSTFTWLTPWSVEPGNNFKVKVTSLTSPNIFDFSNNNFSISRGTITVLSPNGGETWAKGTMHPILWNDNLCENVRIELWKGNLFNSVIANSVPSTGTFAWMIPNVNTLIAGSDYKVKILALGAASGTTGLVFDFSNSTFTIAPAPGTAAPIVFNIEKVYPNPCDNELSLKFSGSSDSPVSLKIFNFLGNQVYQEVFGMISQDQTIDVNVSGLPEGIYLYISSCDEQLIGRGQFRIVR